MSIKIQNQPKGSKPTSPFWSNDKDHRRYITTIHHQHSNILPTNVTCLIYQTHFMYNKKTYPNVHRTRNNIPRVIHFEKHTICIFRILKLNQMLKIIFLNKPMYLEYHFFFNLSPYSISIFILRDSDNIPNLIDKLIPPTDSSIDSPI